MWYPSRVDQSITNQEFQILNTSCLEIIKHCTHIWNCLLVHNFWQWFRTPGFPCRKLSHRHAPSKISVIVQLFEKCVMFKCQFRVGLHKQGRCSPWSDLCAQLTPQKASFFADFLKLPLSSEDLLLKRECFLHKPFVLLWSLPFNF